MRWISRGEGEELDRKARGDRCDADASAERATGARAPGDRVSGNGARHQRKNEITTAARVLLRVGRRPGNAVGATVLVGGDVLVLHGVPRRRLRTREEPDARDKPQCGGGNLLTDDRAEFSAGDGAQSGGGSGCQENPRVLHCESCARASKARGGDDRDRFGKAQCAAKHRYVRKRSERESRLRARGNRYLAVGFAHRDGPARRAVDKQTVSEGHTPDACVLRCVLGLGHDDGDCSAAF